MAAVEVPPRLAGPSITALDFLCSRARHPELSPGAVLELLRSQRVKSRHETETKQGCFCVSVSGSRTEREKDRNRGDMNLGLVVSGKTDSKESRKSSGGYPQFSATTEIDALKEQKTLKIDELRDTEHVTSANNAIVSEICDKMALLTSSVSPMKGRRRSMSIRPGRYDNGDCSRSSSYLHVGAKEPDFNIPESELEKRWLQEKKEKQRKVQARSKSDRFKRSWTMG